MSTSELLAQIESAHATGVGDPWELLGRATRALAAADAKDRGLIFAGAELGWDAAVKSMQYDDGSPVEFVKVVNPYRKSSVEVKV